jgi:hypothetical protein
MTNLDLKEVGELRNLVLIDDPPPAADKSSTEPPTFQGSVTLGTYATSKFSDHTVPLATMNIILRRAFKCPAPIH